MANLQKKTFHLPRLAHDSNRHDAGAGAERGLSSDSYCLICEEEAGRTSVPSSMTSLPLQQGHTLCNLSKQSTNWEPEVYIGACGATLIRSPHQIPPFCNTLSLVCREPCDFCLFLHMASTIIVTTTTQLLIGWQNFSLFRLEF